MSINDYLDKVDKYLRTMPAVERIDIVKEIKSEMLELEAEGLSPNTSFSWGKSYGDIR